MVNGGFIYNPLELKGGINIENIKTALIKCLNDKASVDIGYIAAHTNMAYNDVIEGLKGLIYFNPETKKYETADEYLSGNIKKKLDAAVLANKLEKGQYQTNIEALERVMPDRVTAKDIYITLGSPWVPTDIIEEYIRYMIKQSGGSWGDSHVTYNQIEGTWKVDFKFKFLIPDEFNDIYGTKRKKALSILVQTLNNREIAVYDKISHSHNGGRESRVKNQKETIYALEKQAKMVKEFQTWVWKDQVRKQRLEDIYNYIYGSILPRKYDGSYLELPGMSPEISLYQYQKDAVARIIMSSNTLLAHDVGAGKTYIMIASGMELKRLNTSEKIMYVVPNSIVGQWIQQFKGLYPKSNVKCIGPDDFTTKRRQSILRDIRDNSYDAIIIASSCFTRIPCSDAKRIHELNEEIKELKNRKRFWGHESEKIDAKIDRLKRKLDTLKEKQAKSGICFDDLGITHLFVDEAHNFKNALVFTGISGVYGLTGSVSQKCLDMFSKVRIVQRQSKGSGVIFATGTPVTNTLCEAYVMQDYLQKDILQELGLGCFDSWVGMFGERTCNFEIDVDTTNYRMVNRISKFHNIPELSKILSLMTDYHSMEGTEGVPNHDGYRDVLISKTDELDKYLQNISKRADAVRSRIVEPQEDNMLKITTDGRKAALDLRLINECYEFNKSSKAYECAKNVVRIYKEASKSKLTQLVFCDSSTPKIEFNMYSELKRLLVEMGVNKNDIAFIHDAKSEEEKERLYQSVRLGKIRILIGSTPKLGLGVNVQDKLIAVHHLDIPWRPADMTQREGRILRQGNENENVEIYRYITEGSFDAYSYQLLEAKQRFISSILSGNTVERDSADIDGTVLDYAEVKALAIGHPLMKERIEISNEISKYRLLEMKAINQRREYEAEQKALPDRITKLDELISQTSEDAAFMDEHKQEYTTEERKKIREKIYHATHRKDPNTEEKRILTYQGFEIFAAANSSKSHPVVKLKRVGDYSIELGSSARGDLARIDNFLSKLHERCVHLQDKLDELKRRHVFIACEVAKETSYQGEVAILEKRLQRIDKKLGVDKSARSA